MDSNICTFNQTGYCKFGQVCNKVHENNICEKSICEDLQCKKRHPKVCKYFMMNHICKFGSQCAFSHRKAVKSVELESALQEISRLKIEVSNLKKTVEFIFLMKQNEESLKKDIYDLSKEIETLKDYNQEIHYKIRLIEEELEESFTEEEQSVDDDDSESYIDNNNLEDEPVHLNQELEVNVEMEKDADKQTENSDKVPHKEISMEKDKPTDETNKDFLESEFKTLDEKNTIEITSKLTVEFNDVCIDEEKKVDWESLYMEHVEGQEMRVEDMVDFETLFKEYVLNEDIES